jgi:hypothetical protein
MAAVKYGLFLALLMFALGEWAPQPAGAIVRTEDDWEQRNS